VGALLELGVPLAGVGVAGMRDGTTEGPTRDGLAQAVVALPDRQSILLSDDEDHGLLVAVGPRDGREGLDRREAEGRE